MKPVIAIIFGGKSAEHEVSLVSATNIYHAIDGALFEPLLLGVDKDNHWQFSADYAVGDVDLAKRSYFEASTQVYLHPEGQRTAIHDLSTGRVLRCFDVAFPIIHGSFGEDGTLQGALKALGTPFVGPDVLGSAVAMDKDVAKRLLHEAGIPVAAGYVVCRHESTPSFEEVSARLGLPVFVKPANAGSSVGVSKASDKATYEQALCEAFRYDRKALIEEAVIGKEVECAVLGNEEPKASVVGEIVPTHDFYSYEAKYKSADGAVMQIPAKIDSATAEAIRQTAVKAFRTTGCEGMARVDFLLDNDGRFVLNELNTLPGFTSISMYPKLWEATGMSYKDLITKLIDLALARHQRDERLADASTADDRKF